MSNLTLTDQESAAFDRAITRDLALDYFFVFDNAPQQFLYHDAPIPGELTDLERRNKVITETLWLDAYHQNLLCNVPFLFTYRGAVLQMPLQTHQVGAGMFTPPAQDRNRSYATAEGVQANFDAWMKSEGSKMAADMREKPARGSWQSLLETPDRTSRIVSIMPIGNQMLLELVSTWTEAGILKETAWVVVLIYDVDGSVLQDRSYIEMANWPSGPKFEKAQAKAPRVQTQTVGVMDEFYEYQKNLQHEITHTDLEKRNLSIVEGAWLEAQNAGLDTNVFHPARFRMQWPLQKCSTNLNVSKEIGAMVRETAPDTEMRLALTYAKGSQVVVEGVLSWHEDGVGREAPFISFLLLDKDGLVIRDRRYLTLGNCPGAASLKARFGL